MDEIHKKVLENDLRQATGFFERLKNGLKGIYYSFSRPFNNVRLGKKLRRFGVPLRFFDEADCFLLDDGGMSKGRVYGKCDSLAPLRDASVLVPGVGYGRNLFQLAAWKPKTIVAFDLYRYEEEWVFLRDKIRDEFGTELVFYEGGFESLPKSLENSFDFIISDAVLEHVKNMPDFVAQSKVFLKDNGVFYASFGPIWYGPCGDHLDWEGSEIFNHLVFSGGEYDKRIKEVFGEPKIADDSCEGFFLLKEKLFSYLKAEEYFNLFFGAGFRKELICAKISSRATKLAEAGDSVFKELDRLAVPEFDRFCGGMYFWLRLKK